MQILLIEDDAMMGSTLTQGLSDLGQPPTELFHCKEIASLPALLCQHAFDAILCRQYHHQAHEGVRLLHEAHHLGLLAPGCVLLLLEQDEDTGQFPPPTSISPCVWPCPSPRSSWRTACKRCWH